MSADCDCCTGIGVETPEAVENRPGLPAISYRIGDYGRFRASMLAAVGATTAHGLRTRETADFSIALLDACAVVGDVLTFYSERIANEAYLRTAVELVSVGELSRLIGYAPAPGCSASVYLAFRLNDPPAIADLGSPGGASVSLMKLSSALGTVITAGTRVQSVPGPGEMPQTFETGADLDARWVANALKPMSRRPYPSGSADIDALFVTSAAGRTVGANLLLAAGSTLRLRTVVGVTSDSDGGARLDLDGGAAPSAPPAPPTANPVWAPAGAFSDALVAETIDGLDWAAADLDTLIVRQGWSTDAVEAAINDSRTPAVAGSALSAWTVRPAALFGASAPRWDSLPPIFRFAYLDAATQQNIPPIYASNWEGATVGYPGSAWATDGTLDLDNIYAAAAPGARIVFVDGATTITAIIAKVRTLTRSLYSVTARVTNVALQGVSGGGLGSLHPRTTAVYIQDAPMALAPTQVADDVAGKTVTLDRCILRLDLGRQVLVTGERRDRPGRTSVEVATVAEIRLIDGFTTLTFTDALDGAYAIDTVSFNANVALATQGESLGEVLGAGDAGHAFQRFALKQPPLTWTTAANPRGVDAALTVRVNGVAWKRIDFLYGAASTDRVYALTRDLTGATVVQFGDGSAFGARLPTGSENVTAAYRRGIGAAANVAEGQISLLMTRPPGVKDVVNPLAASGGDDPETADEARSNAPFAVKTLGRIVTMADYGDFVRASAGVAKARVDLAWRGGQRLIVITVAGAAGAAIPDASPAHDALVCAINAAAEAQYSVVLRTFRPRSFAVAASVRLDPDYLQDAVFAQITNALHATFAFAARGFGQTVFASEVVAAIQAVPGVVALELDRFDYTDAASPGVQSRLDAEAALSGSDVVGAELLTLDVAPPVLTVATWS